MRYKLDTNFSVKGKVLHVELGRLHLKDKKPIGFDVLFFLTIGYGTIPGTFNKGFVFYIDALRFNVDKTWESMGFSIPIKLKKIK